METPGRAAAIDYGTVRIGIAISDARRTIASPHSMYARRDRQQDAAFFKRLAADEDVRLFVVGLPVHLDGRESQKSLESRAFGQWLAEVTGVEVVFYDERFTTTQAHEILTDGQMRGRRRRQRLDMLAAQVMLTAFLESGGHGQTDPKGLDDLP
jgi:putative holliday junction resolvase